MEMVDFFEVLRTSTCIVHEPSRRSEKPGAAAIGSGGNRRQVDREPALFFDQFSR